MTHRRESTGSDRYSGSGNGDLEVSSAGSGGGGGIRRTKSRDFDDEDGSTDNTSWAWKEPPMLRRMETSRTAGRSRSRSRGASPAVRPDRSYPTEESPTIDLTASMSSATDRRQQQRPADLDFWDPLGLMSNITPQTPMTARSVAGSQRSGEEGTPRSTPGGTPRGTPRGTPGGTPSGSPMEPRGCKKKPKGRHTE